MTKVVWERALVWERESHEALTRGGWPAGVPKPEAHCARALRLWALMGREPFDQASDLVSSADVRWHISVQHEERIPDWAELVAAAHSLRPGVPFVVGIPPRSWWLNAHPRVLHLVETKDAALVARWREEARGDVPSGAGAVAGSGVSHGE